MAAVVASLPPSAAQAIRIAADDAARGRIAMFGRWPANFGHPIDWQLDPTSGRRWNVNESWSKAMRKRDVGDIKLTWEVGRFPHLFVLGRAAAAEPHRRRALAEVARKQIAAFIHDNPYGQGIHWASGQEIAIRLLAFLFARSAFGQFWPADFHELLAQHVLRAVFYIDEHIEYARFAVYNNHLIGEALALYLGSKVLDGAPELDAMGRKGRRLLTGAALRQFYPDGGYIQQSHNYHRVALHYLVVAIKVARCSGDTEPVEWTTAVNRSIDFLYALQNPKDGALPNYGANDGAMILPLTSCDYSDFRPMLQCASILSRGNRLYQTGPWDEESRWLGLDGPVAEAGREGRTFPFSGHHVLRPEPDTFAVLRCGTLRDRFSQIDMLHLDFWFRGVNLLVDGGSYLYNGPREWYEHFFRTASHNTVVVDGADQMVHYRQFKVLYPTEARLRRFDVERGVMAGEHYGYRRLRGRPVHRRDVWLRNGILIVVDRVSGGASHTARLHWLLAGKPGARDGEYETPAGAICLSVTGNAGSLDAVIATGRQNPPAGWVSRYYGEKTPATSLAFTVTSEEPLFVTVVSPRPNSIVRNEDGTFALRSAESAITIDVRDEDVRFEERS